MSTSIPSLSYNYYHNETKNDTFKNEQPKRIASYGNISTLEGDPLDSGKIHHHSKNATNGTITFPLKAKIMRNKKENDFNGNILTKGLLLFCFAEDQNDNNDIQTKKEDDVCTIVDLETLNILLAQHYGKKENEMEDTLYKEEKKPISYWKRWNFVGYVRNELHPTAKAKGYRLLNVDVSGVTRTKNYWNHLGNNHEIQRGTELFLVLQKRWIHKVGKHVFQWIPIIGYPANHQEKEYLICIGSVLENNKYVNYNDDEKLIDIYF